jgi:hypothetical protein
MCSMKIEMNTKSKSLSFYLMALFCTWTGLKFGILDVDSIGVKFLIPITLEAETGVCGKNNFGEDSAKLGGVFDTDVWDLFKARRVWCEEGRPGPSRTFDWRGPGGELLGDEMEDGGRIPERTFGPDPFSIFEIFCRGMMLTTPLRFPGGPTGRCWMSPTGGLGCPPKVSRGGDGIGPSGLIRISGGGRVWLCPSCWKKS